jgi:hypothetical protein
MHLRVARILRTDDNACLERSLISSRAALTTKILRYPNCSYSDEIQTREKQMARATKRKKAKTAAPVKARAKKITKRGIKAIAPAIGPVRGSQVCGAAGFAGGCRL